MPAEDYWNCYRSWDLLTAWLVGQPYWWSRSQPYPSPECAGSIQNLAKPNTPSSEAVKATPDSGKKSQPSAKQIAGLFWKDPERGKEDAEAHKQEEKHRKKPTGPVLSLDNHEDSVTALTNQAAPSRVSQPPSKAPSLSSKDRGKTQREHLLVTDMLDKADEPKPKSRKRDPTPEIVVLDDDDSTPLPGNIKGMGKKSCNYNAQEEEAIETLASTSKVRPRLSSKTWSWRS